MAAAVGKSCRRELAVAVCHFCNHVEFLFEFLLADSVIVRAPHMRNEVFVDSHVLYRHLN